MNNQMVFQWLEGQGWLVLSGGMDIHSDIRAMALGRTTADGGVAYLSFAPDGGDQLLDDMEDLGAPSGYIVDIHEDADTIYEQLKDAGIIVIEPGNSGDEVTSVLMGQTVAGIQAAYEQGAVVLVEGVAARAFGQWQLTDDYELIEGLGWITDAIVMPSVTSISDSPAAAAALRSSPDMKVIGIGAGSAIALGPNQAIELWAKKQVTISLGHV